MWPRVIGRFIAYVGWRSIREKFSCFGTGSTARAPSKLTRCFTGPFLRYPGLLKSRKGLCLPQQLCHMHQPLTSRTTTHRQPDPSAWTVTSVVSSWPPSNAFSCIARELIWLESGGISATVCYLFRTSPSLSPPPTSSHHPFDLIQLL